MTFLTATSPNDHISEAMTDQMIEFAGNNLLAANAILGQSVEDTAENLKAVTSRERYDASMARAKESADLVYSALQKGKQ